jgi:hypothetical protein
MKLPKRVLLLGCPRSGTTILQSILASHPDIISLPETHFFPSIVHQFSFLRKLGIVPRSSILKLNYLSSKLKTNKPKFRFYFTRKAITNCFISTLDKYASDNSCKFWLEKTPQNIFFLPLIKELDDKLSLNLKYIHIERNPEDVISSIHYASCKYPSSWGYRNIDDAINLFKKSHLMNNKYRENKNHFFCKYDELIKNVESVTSEIQRFISIRTVNNLHVNCGLQHNHITNLHEPWKDGIKKGLTSCKSRFHDHFNQEQQEKVKKALESFL